MSRTPMPLRVSSSLRIELGGATVTLTPRQGLRLAEELARKSFQRVAAEAVAGVPLEPKPRASGLPRRRL